MHTLLKNYNFMLLFSGRIITNAGDSLYTVASMWLVYALSGSAFYSGLAGFLVMAPAVLQFLTGPLIDQWSVKTTLIYTQAAQGLLVLFIAVTAFLNLLTVPLLLIIMPVISMLNQFVYPAQNALLPSILPKDDLVKGNAAFSFAYQGVELAFNALAGVLIAILGATLLFVIDSITFAVTTILFSMLRLPKTTENTQTGEKQTTKAAIEKYGVDLREGFQFVMRSILAKFFGGAIVANFAIGATLAVLPVYAAEKGGPELYGFYLAALSAGSLLGALLASRLEKYPLGKLIIVAFIISGTLWIGSIFASWPYVGAVMFGLAWLPVGATNVMLAAAIQRLVPTRLLARTFAVTASFSACAAPLGSLLGGTIASFTSGTVVFGIAGCGFLYITIHYTAIHALRTLPPAQQLDEKHLQLKETS